MVSDSRGSILTHTRASRPLRRCEVAMATPTTSTGGHLGAVPTVPRARTPGDVHIPANTAGALSLNSRQDRAKRNQDRSPEPHGLAGPPCTAEPQLRPHPKPRAQPRLFLQLLCPTGLCWWRKT